MHNGRVSNLWPYIFLYPYKVRSCSHSLTSAALNVRSITACCIPPSPRRMNSRTKCCSLWAEHTVCSCSHKCVGINTRNPNNISRNRRLICHVFCLIYLLIFPQVCIHFHLSYCTTMLYLCQASRKHSSTACSDCRYWLSHTWPTGASTATYTKRPLCMVCLYACSPGIRSGTTWKKIRLWCVHCHTFLCIARQRYVVV